MGIRLISDDLGRHFKEALHQVGCCQEVCSKVLTQQALVAQSPHFSKNALVLDQLLGNKF